MPVHRVGKDCWQWGHHGHVYCGPGARQKAERQGRAAYSHGYRGKEVGENAKPDPYRNASSDLEDAYEYVEGEIDRNPVFIETRARMPLDEILQWGDYSSWGEWDRGELIDMDPDELFDALVSFRGAQWAETALRWLDDGIPAVVLAEFNEGTDIADGRGRVSFAVGFDIPELPVIVLREAKKNLSEKRDDPIGLSITEYGTTFTTGEPVTFQYLRGTTSAPKPPPGDPYQQRIEPAGRYMTHVPDARPAPGWETGVVHFESPLVIPRSSDPNGPIYNENSWKAELSRMFDGKTGRALSKAILRAGYDGIVTVTTDSRGRPIDTTEIVDLAPLRTMRESSVSRLHVLRLIAEDQALGAASNRVARQLLADGLIVRYGNDGYALTRAGIDELLRHETQED